MKTPKNKEKIKNFLNKISTFDERASMSLVNFEKEVDSLAHKVKQEVTLSTLESVKSEISRIKKAFDLSPLLTELKSLKDEFKTLTSNLGTDMSSEYQDVIATFETSFADISKKLDTALAFVDSVDEDVKALDERSETETGNLKTLVSTTSKSIREEMSESSREAIEFKKGIEEKVVRINSDLKEIRESISDAKTELTARITSVGGGNMNRQIKVDGTEMSKKYTDVNFVGGSGVTITTSNDDTDRNVNITFSSAGGNSFTGSVNGINNVFVFTTAPNALSIDNVPRQRVSSDTTVNWTIVGTTVTLTVAPNFDLFPIN